MAIKLEQLRYSVVLVDEEITHINLYPIKVFFVVNSFNFIVSFRNNNLLINRSDQNVTHMEVLLKQKQIRTV